MPHKDCVIEYGEYEKFPEDAKEKFAEWRGDRIFPGRDDAFAAGYFFAIAKFSCTEPPAPPQACT